MIHLAILLVVQQRLYIIKTATHTSKHFNFQQALGHNNLPICVVHFQFDGGGAESRCHIDTTGTILGSYCVLLSASSSFLIGYRDGMTILYNHHKVERWLSGPFTTTAAASSTATTTGIRITGASVGIGGYSVEIDAGTCGNWNWSDDSNSCSSTSSSLVSNGIRIRIRRFWGTATRIWSLEGIINRMIFFGYNQCHLTLLHILPAHGHAAAHW